MYMKKQLHNINNMACLVMVIVFENYSSCASFKSLFSFVFNQKGIWLHHYNHNISIISKRGNVSLGASLTTFVCLYLSLGIPQLSLSTFCSFRGIILVAYVCLQLYLRVPNWPSIGSIAIGASLAAYVC